MQIVRQRDDCVLKPLAALDPAAVCGAICTPRQARCAKMTRSRMPLPVLLAASLASCASVTVDERSSSTPPTEPGAPPTRAFNELGPADAPVTIIEFSDYQCPYCAHFALETFPGIRRAYVDTGKVRYAARDLPLPFHAFAVPAAVAARCAGEQGRFWEYRDELFRNQSQIGRAPYAELASQLGLDQEKFEACRAAGQQEAAVRADAAMARSHGISSTPSFVVGRFVDGEFEAEKFSGSKSPKDFAARIDAALATAK
jgi:protein-disulfide isomerase